MTSNDKDNLFAFFAGSLCTIIGGFTLYAIALAFFT